MICVRRGKNRTDKVIAALAEKYSNGEMMLGAGTVLDPETARMAILAGANFIVSPAFNAETAKLCNRYRVPYMPGCATITEVITAMEAGADSVDDVKACISRVGLDPDDKKPFRKYSLGMKQKLGIACAIMENPELLILDEPFNALDEKGISIIKDIIEEFRDNGAIVIMSCHDKELLCDISDVIIDMYEGKVTNES